MIFPHLTKSLISNLKIYQKCHRKFLSGSENSWLSTSSHGTFFPDLMSIRVSTLLNVINELHLPLALRVLMQSRLSHKKKLCFGLMGDISCRPKNNFTKDGPWKKWSQLKRNGSNTFAISIKRELQLESIQDWLLPEMLKSDLRL